MIKKFLKFFKFCAVCALWSACWLTIMRFLVVFVWNFDYFSLRNWQIIVSFWNANGTIQGFSDYMLFITLLGILIVWYIGVKYFYRIDYGKLFLKPFEYFSKKQIEKYDSTGKHIVLKNLVVGEKMTIDELVEEKIKEEDNRCSQKESQNLRESISKKIIERKGQ